MAIFRRAANPALAACARQASTAAPSLLRLNEVVDGVRFRTPTLEDARTMFEIVTSGSLDDNSAYAYMVFSTHFASTCIVAEEPESGAPLGFVMGYCPPTDPEAFFCWQVGVTEAARGRGVARRMMESLCKGLADTSGVKYLEATVTPDNEASRRLFAGFGRRAGCPVKVTEDHFPQAMFPPGHDAEGLFRVGPFEASDIGAHDSGRA